VALAAPFEQAGCVRLDETALDAPLEVRGGEIRLRLPAHALRSIRVRPGTGARK
jgi:hypothetical protein